MDFSDIFRIVNLAVGVLMILGGVSQFFPSIQVQNVIIAVYVIIFGLGTGALEFQIPPLVSKYASFMFSFLGRGVFYVFVGCVISSTKWYHYVPGVVIVIVGLGYAALEFVPSIEPPANMRDADPSWGAEQI
ncbi:MAG: Late Golgi vesicles protein [Chrysothrix sp. TS-e1954]|nr:MAG: Late Golgi vesicles protein [Chrysothrix sp. TS-e1954]